MQKNLENKTKLKKKIVLPPSRGFLIQMIIRKHHLPQLAYVYVIPEDVLQGLRRDFYAYELNLFKAQKE